MSSVEADWRTGNYEAGDPPVRIDYLLISGLTAHSYEVLDGRCGDGTSLSDHMGLQAELSPGSSSVCAADEPAASATAAAFQEALKILRQGAFHCLAFSSLGSPCTVCEPDALVLQSFITCH